MGSFRSHSFLRGFFRGAPRPVRLRQKLRSNIVFYFVVGLNGAVKRFTGAFYAAMSGIHLQFFGLHPINLVVYMIINKCSGQ